MTTHIRVSSTCTPTPLVCELFLVRIEGLMKSPWGALLRPGLYCPSFDGAEVGGGIAEGMTGLTEPRSLVKFEGPVNER